MRTHVVLPDELVSEIDRAVGKRKRSEFLADAARERLVRARQRGLIERTAGILRAEDYPGWATADMISAWVRAQRTGTDWWLPSDPPPPDWRKHLDT